MVVSDVAVYSPPEPCPFGSTSRSIGKSPGARWFPAWDRNGGERRDEVLFIGARKLGCIVDTAMEENLKSEIHRTCLMGYKQTLSPQIEGCTL